MTYKQLLELIQKMSEAQQGMEVLAFIDNSFRPLSVVMHVDTDLREFTSDDEEENLLEDQPVLV